MCYSEAGGRDVNPIAEGTLLRVVSLDSGETEFRKVTRVLGSRWWARSIPVPEPNARVTTVFVHLGLYPGQAQNFA
jgi:hypothetical protein